MELVAHEVTLELCPSTGVHLWLMSDCSSEWSGSYLVVEVGDLRSRQRLELLVEARLPNTTKGQTTSVEFCVTDAAGPISASPCVRTLTRLSPECVRWETRTSRSDATCKLCWRCASGCPDVSTDLSLRSTTSW